MPAPRSPSHRSVCTDRQVTVAAHHQCGGPHNTRIRTELGEDDPAPRHEAHPGVARERLPRGHDQQVAGCRDTAADRHHIEFEQVRRAGDRDPQRLAGSGERRHRNLITVVRGVQQGAAVGDLAGRG